MNYIKLKSHKREKDFFYINLHNINGIVKGEDYTRVYAGGETLFM